MTGPALKDLLDYAKDRGFAMPGVNIVGTDSINSCLEAAAKYGCVEGTRVRPHPLLRLRHSVAQI